MSLLNEVLKDLDARQAVAAGRRPLPSAVRPLPALRKSRRTWGLVAALLASALVAGIGAFVALRPSASDAPRAAADVVAAPAASPSAAPTAPPAHSAEPAAPVPPVASEAPAVVATGEPASAAPVSDTLASSAPAPEAVLRRSEDVRPVLPKAAVKPSGPSAAPPVVRSAERTERAEKGHSATPEEKSEKAEKPAKAAIERSETNVAGERVDVEYRKAITALNQGRVVEAIEGLRGVLRGDPLQRAARQLLVKLLLEAGRSDEAVDVLRDGLRGQPAQIGWAMALARLQVDRGDLPGAWTTLDASLPAAGNSADYQGFTGNVLQRLGRSREAIARFQAAVRLAPGDGRWWLGLGLAHDAEGENEEARAAFLHARQTTNLTPELLALIERKLR